jgi:NAD(P)-dependent dehydrogenase (short-subunit alcohol dehydrogenase family)
MELGLTGQVAMVTGGSQGIGKATALALAREGVQVAICARGRESLQQTAAAIQAETGRTVLAVQADMTRLEDIQRFVATTARSWEGLTSWSIASTPEPHARLARSQSSSDAHASGGSTSTLQEIGADRAASLVAT